ncbi:MAG TPA: MBL fold metallo-hydrolase [Acidimicrobiales bacterium]|nr:MBL fold metallo-hydrolase [Acidimicrobiales bacterium]
MPEIVHGVPVAISRLVRRLTCHNPSVFTGPGTNTYLVGQEEIAVIDPGPDDDAHLDAIAAAGGDRIRWIVVTHTHGDHSPGAEPLRRRLRPDVLVLGNQARDDFDPDAEIGDGHVVDGREFSLRAIHTPGHAGNHLCYLLEEEGLLFSGDHVMSGSTVVIGPPDGDMAVYLDSLAKVKALGAGVKAIAPAHGDLIADPRAKIDEYVAHRLRREEKVVAALADVDGPRTIDQLVPAVYADVDEGRHWIARRSLWAHLRKLAAEGRVSSSDVDDEADGTWEIRSAR